MQCVSPLQRAVRVQWHARPASQAGQPDVQPTAPSLYALLRPARQVSLLRRLFKAALGDEAAKLVDINTIDGFQVGKGGGMW